MIINLTILINQNLYILLNQVYSFYALLFLLNFIFVSSNILSEIEASIFTPASFQPKINSNYFFEQPLSILFSIFFTHFSPSKSLLQLLTLSSESKISLSKLFSFIMCLVINWRYRPHCIFTFTLSIYRLYLLIFNCFCQR